MGVCNTMLIAFNQYFAGYHDTNSKKNMATSKIRTEAHLIFGPCRLTCIQDDVPY